MGEICLEGMEFFAYHGLFDEEQKVGNRFTVDLKIETNFSKAGQTDLLKDTINYAEVYQIVKLCMEEKHRLLEHLAYQIVNKIKANFPQAKGIEVKIDKHNPPIGGVCKNAAVILRA